MDKNDKIIILNLAVMACASSKTGYTFTAEQIIGYARDFEKYVSEGNDVAGQNKVFPNFAKKVPTGA
jgi:hypothetical protein